MIAVAVAVAAAVSVDVLVLVLAGTRLIGATAAAAVAVDPALVSGGGVVNSTRGTVRVYVEYVIVVQGTVWVFVCTLVVRLAAVAAVAVAAVPAPVAVAAAVAVETAVIIAGF